MTSDTDFAQTYVGSPLYMSPELCNSSHYNHKSDVWSLGCLIYELSCLEPPFQSKTQIGLSQKIRQGKFNALPAHYSSELHRIVKLMLTVDHNLRPSCTDLMKIGRIKMYCLEQELAVKISQLEIRERNLIDRERKLQERENELLKRERDSREPETRKSLSNFVSRSRRFLLDSKENY